MWCMVVVAFADLDVAFPSRMKLFVLISNSKEEHTIFAIRVKAAAEGDSCHLHQENVKVLNCTYLS